MKHIYRYRFKRSGLQAALISMQAEIESWSSPEVLRFRRQMSWLIFGHGWWLMDCRLLCRRLRLLIISKTLFNETKLINV